MSVNSVYLLREVYITSDMRLTTKSDAVQLYRRITQRCNPIPRSRITGI